ncbi:MAG: PAC2 family protein [Chloroflexi bacterium]|nr:PAC2 family protein [Chloroflexota bacterium]
MARQSDVVYTARPSLRQPYMVIGLNGWVDGGETATGSLRFLRRKLRPRKLAEIPLGRFHVYQVPGQLSLRPHCRVEEGLLKQYLPQRNVFYYWVNPHGDRDVILFQGVEPNLNWEEYAAAVLGVAREFEVSRIYMLGGVLDKTPHTREPGVSCVCTSEELRDDLAHRDIDFVDYEGPGGIRTTLMYLCQRLHLEMALLHAHVTYYPEFNMVITHNPKAIRAVLKRLNRLMSLDLDLGELDRQAGEFEARLSYMALQNREFQSYVEALEKDYAEPEANDAPELSADEAVHAVEELLRGHSDDEG